MALATFEEEQIKAVSDSPFLSAGFAEKATSHSLNKEFADIALGMATQVDKIALRLLHCTTIEEFQELRKEQFPIFVNLSKAFSNLVLASIPPSAVGRIAQESLVNTEQEFVSQGPFYLSDDDYKEVLFSISTLKSAQKLIPQIISAKPSNEIEDQKLSVDYFIATIYSKMHLHCLQIAMAESMSLNRGILEVLLEGMRASVMAYAYARAGIEFRGLPKYEDDQEEVIWDEEDQALANAE